MKLSDVIDSFAEEKENKSDLFPLQMARWTICGQDGKQRARATACHPVFHGSSLPRAAGWHLHYNSSVRDRTRVWVQDGASLPPGEKRGHGISLRPKGVPGRAAALRGPQARLAA